MPCICRSQLQAITEITSVSAATDSGNNYHFIGNVTTNGLENLCQPTPLELHPYTFSILSALLLGNGYISS